MDSDPEKIEEFDNLDEDVGSGALEEATDDTAIGTESSGVEEVEEIEELELMMDEAPEMVFSKEAQEAKDQEVLVKYCLFCREIIPAEAIACKHCGHVVHIFEGAVFKQLYWFFWGALITLLGTFLPFYNGDLNVLAPSATQTFPGAIYMIFSIILLVAMGMSIYSKRLIMSPVFLLFIPAVHTWIGVIKAVGRIEDPDFAWYTVFYKIDSIALLNNQVGSGYLIVLIGSTMVALTFILSIVTALSGGGKEKPQGASRSKEKSKGKGRRR
ncbi:MAG: hypothetical protein ACYTG7_11560 [Planctomycetota bacterium]|jgi:hypothetical protein